MDIRMLVNEWAAALSGRDPEHLVKAFHEDLHYEDIDLELVFTTKDEVRGFAEPWFAAVPDFSVQLDAVIVDGERACAEWTFTGTQTGELPPNLPASGKPFKAAGISVFEARDGKLVKVVSWGLRSVLKQLGFA